MPRKGENIFKRKDGRWEGRYIHHYENGKARYAYVYGTGYMEVKAKKAAALSEMRNEKNNEAKKLSLFGDLAERWLSQIKISVKESTYTRYYRIISKYLLPLIGSKTVSEIDAYCLSSAADYLLNEGGSKKCGLSPKTVGDIICVIKSILKFGRNNGYTVPEISGLKYPQIFPKKISILSNEKCQAVWEKLMRSDDLVSLGIAVTLYTGIRLGELCGLKWGDINFESAYVTICRTVERIADLNPLSEAKTKIIISEPKTQNSVREIPLPQFLMDYLQERRSANDFYILTGSAKFTEPHQFYIKYKKYLKRNGLGDYTFHSLRHTFATRCVELGFDIKSLSEILGHANVKTTLSVYVHPTMQQKRAQMERLAPV